MTWMQVNFLTVNLNQMRNFLFLMVWAAISSMAPLSLWCQQVWTVCSFETEIAAFQDAQTAINAASAGDIVQLLPSPLPYGDLLLDKSIHLMGPGHAPEALDGLNAEVGQITVAANDVSIEGLRILAIDQGNVPVHNLLVRGNRFYGAGWFLKSNASSTTDNWTAENNVFSPSIPPNNRHLISVHSGDQDWTIRNNHIEIHWPYQRLLSGAAGAVTLSHNLIVGTASQPLAIYNNTSNAVFHSNIIVHDSAPFDIAAGCGGCSILNNVIHSLQGVFSDPDPNGSNTVGVAPEFVNAPEFPVFDVESDYNPTSTSPALGSGLFNVDAGLGGNGMVFSSRGYALGQPRITGISKAYHIIQQGAPLEVELNWESASE